MSAPAVETSLTSGSVAVGVLTVTDAYNVAERRRELLAEAAEWRKVAEIVERGRTYRDAYLCNAIELYLVAEYDAALRQRMLKRVNAHIDAEGRVPSTWGHFGKPGDDQNQRARALAADLLALECEDEAHALTPKPSPRKSAGKTSRRKVSP